MDPTRQFITRLSQSGGMTRTRLRRLKARRWKYPLSLERQYTASISRYLSRQWKEYSAMATRMMVPRSDAVEDLTPLPGTTGPALGGIMNIASSIEAFNRKEMEAFRKIAVGEAFQEDEPWVKSILDTWAREQVSLITKASQDMRDAVARRVRDGVKKGQTGREIEKTVMQEMPGISFRRARVIARDQASKLNASLTQGRMADAGLSTYIWDTAQDERVRGNPGGRYSNALPSHWEMQGKVCRWDDPTVCLDDNGEWVKRPPTAPYFHPGMAIMCRCVALPNWQELEGVKDSGLPAVEPVAMPAAEGPAPVVADDAARVRETAQKITDTLVKKKLLQAQFSAEYAQDLAQYLNRLPEGWRAAWMETASTTKLRSNRSAGRSFFDPETGDISLTSARYTTIVHEMGHATMARLSDPAWLERMYAGLEAKGGIYARYADRFRQLNGSNFRDRAIQVKLGEKMREEWLDGLAEKMRGLTTDDRLALLESTLSEHGVESTSNIRAVVNDWMGLSGRPSILPSPGHSGSYRQGMADLAQTSGAFNIQESLDVALSTEAGAELMELAATENGLKFLQTFLPNTLEFFNKEVIGL